MKAVLFAVDDRPVELGDMVRGLDLTSGAFVRDDGLRSRCDAGGKGVEPLDRAAFDELVTALRRAISHDRQVQSIHWEATGDPEYPYCAAHEGVTYTIQIGDFPAEPIYMLFVDDQEVDALDTWPKAWTR